jgi:hypothetical protein
MAAQNDFATYGYDRTSPGRGVEAVTPSNTVSLVKQARQIYVGTGGSLSVLCADGSSATFVNVPDAFFIDLEVVRVNLTGTTATNIVAIN